MSALTINVQRPTLRIQTGSIPVSVGGSGDVGPDLTAIEALTGTAGVLRKLAADTWGLDTGLASLAGADGVADQLPYVSGVDTWSSSAYTAFARTLLDDASAAAARATLGVANQLVVEATAGASTTDDTTGTSTGISFELPTGTYLITCYLSMTTALTTTAPRFSWQGTGGLVTSDCATQVQVPTAATATQGSQSDSLGVWTAGNNGIGTTAGLVTVQTMIRVTTAGVVTLHMRTEISGSAITLVRGGAVATKVA